MDIYALNLHPPHFLNKVRGKLAVDTEFFGKGCSMKSMDEFVPPKITRRDVSKQIARVYDPLGKVAVYMAKPKVLLRRTVEASPDWDVAMPMEVEVRVGGGTRGVQ